MILLKHPLIIKRPVHILTNERNQHHHPVGGARSQHLHQDHSPHIKDNLVQDLLCQEGGDALSHALSHQGSGDQDLQQGRNPSPGLVQGPQREEDRRALDTPRGGLDQGITNYHISVNHNALTYACIKGIR